jgi:hypothetical protein
VPASSSKLQAHVIRALAPWPRASSQRRPEEARLQCLSHVSDAGVRTGWTPNPPFPRTAFPSFAQSVLLEAGSPINDVVAVVNFRHTRMLYPCPALLSPLMPPLLVLVLVLVLVLLLQILTTFPRGPRPLLTFLLRHLSCSQAAHIVATMVKADDPYYNRKPIPDSLIADVGITGLTPQEEYHNRERKFSAADGTDIRSHSLKAITKPGDPYYNRKQLSDVETTGVADLNSYMTPAEQYEVRERKQSMFQISDDPFAAMTGTHRKSSIVPGEIGVLSEATRRRSSAVAPDHAHAAATAVHHSGYDGSNQLQPIESRIDAPAAGPSDAGGSGTTAADGDVHSTPNGHTNFYDQATGRVGHDDDIGPHDTSKNAVAT